MIGALCDWSVTAGSNDENWQIDDEDGQEDDYGAI